MYKIEIKLETTDGLTLAYELELPGDESVGPPIVYLPGLKKRYFARVDFSRYYIETQPVELALK